MKVSFYIIIFLICFGAADVILTGAGLTGRATSAWEQDQMADALNATKIVESLDPSVNQFFEIGTGLRFLWNLNEPLIGSFTAWLQAYGAPDVIVDPIKIIYRFAFMGLVIEFLSGREFMP